jgi:hydrogenase-1 operon protein HyaF
MHPFPIPVELGIALGRSLGPGAVVEAEPLDYLPLPESMRTFGGLALPEPEEVRDRTEARRVLALVLKATRDWRPGRPPIAIDLAGLPVSDLGLVDQILGEGEVSARVEGGSCTCSIQESVLAGVWRVRESDGVGRPLADRIEVGDLPAPVSAAAALGLARPVDLPPATPGLMNGPGLLAEIESALELRRLAGEGAADHSINLSLLPFSPEDGAWLDACLGRGPTTILSRGYGNCRIAATALRGLWWVQYFNSQDVLILNSIEATEVPLVARAAAEDLQDSAVRLADILGWLG